MFDTHLFWAYGDFSNLESLCVASFARLGYRPIVWTYGNLSNAPPTARIRNARDLIGEDQIFLNRRGSYASFADLFRYTVLSRFGGLYVDTDVFALRRAAKAPRSKYLVSERPREGLSRHALRINSNVIFNDAPAQGDLIDLALTRSAHFPRERISWGEIGPDLLSDLVQEHPQHGFEIKPPDFANPIDWWDSPGAFLDKNRAALPKGSSFLHLYNEMWRRSGVDRNAPYPKGSLMYLMSHANLHNVELGPLLDKFENAAAATDHIGA